MFLRGWPAFAFRRLVLLWPVTLQEHFRGEGRVVNRSVTIGRVIEDRLSEARRLRKLDVAANSRVVKTCVCAHAVAASHAVEEVRYVLDDFRGQPLRRLAWNQPKHSPPANPEDAAACGLAFSIADGARHRFPCLLPPEPAALPTFRRPSPAPWPPATNVFCKAINTVLSLLKIDPRKGVRQGNVPLATPRAML